MRCTNRELTEGLGLTRLKQTENMTPPSPLSGGIAMSSHRLISLLNMQLSFCTLHHRKSKGWFQEEIG